MSIAETIRAKLAAALSPTRLVIKDESHLHAGHAGARAGGQSHFRVLVVSPLFVGQTPVARQRAVNAALKEELAGPVHALAMKTLTPQEFLAAPE